MWISGAPSRSIINARRGVWDDLTGLAIWTTPSVGMKIDVSTDRRGLPGSASLIVLAAFVLLFKGLKLGRAYLAWHDAWLVYGLAVCAVAAAALVVFLVLRGPSRRFRKGPTPAWKAALALGLAVVVLEAVIGLATRSLELLTLRLVGVCAWDLFLLLFLLVVFFVAVRRYPRVTNSAAVIVSITLLLAYALETGYFLRTGVVGDWLLLKFLIENYDVAAAVAEDVDVVGILIVIVPLATLVVSVVAASLVRDGMTRFPHARVGRACAFAAVVVLLIGLVFPTRWLPSSYQVHSGSLGLRLAGDLFSTGVTRGRVAPREFDLPYYSENVSLEGVGSEEPKNVVIILLESARARSTPPENRDGLWMPFLDSLMQKSIVFPRMYTTIPYTTDALLAIFGGVVPPFSTTSRYDQVVSVGWPGLLAQAGYATGFVTTSFLNDKRYEREMLRRLGFEMIAGAQDLDVAEALVSNYSGFDDDMLIDTSLAWVDAVRQDGRPFLLACLTQSSHHPYAVPSSFEVRQAAVPDRELSMYLNTLSYTDAVLRKLYGEFATRGLLDSTLFLFVGDHGESFGEKGERFHGMNVWEEGVRVPFVVHATGLAPDRRGSRVDEMYQQTDVFPTVLKALGFGLAGPHLAGRSALSDDGRREIFVGSAGSRAMALVRDSLKFVYHYRRRPTQVFDLYNDPNESRDIAALVADSLVSAAERELLAWQIAANSRHVR